VLEKKQGKAVHETRITPDGGHRLQVILLDVGLGVVVMADITNKNFESPSTKYMLIH